MAKSKKKSSKKAAKPAAKKASRRKAKGAVKAVAKSNGKKKGAKKAAPAAAGKKARKSKRGKKARVTGKSKQVTGSEEPAPVVDALSFNSIVGRGSSGSGSGGSRSSDITRGSKAPPFELPDQDGSSVSSKALKGKPYILYFYPKDDTPGCTIEACDFRDSAVGFVDAGVRVIGVSPDTVASHDKFRQKYGLKFTLLADAERELAKAYGVWALKKNYGKEYMGIVRSTFLVNANGVVQKAWRGIKAKGHVARVLDEARAMS